MRIEIIPGPAFAASYLINGDTSDIDDAMRAAIDAWRERNLIVNILDVGEEYFSKAWHIYLPEWRAIEPNAMAGMLAEYTCEVRT